MPQFYAHSENDGGTKEALCQHLGFVANRAAEYASLLGAAEEARAAGLLHDLGKYSERFGQRLTDPTVSGVDHWSPGAAAARILYGSKNPAKAVALAAAIEGHHLGLSEAKVISLPEADTALGEQARNLGLPDKDAFHRRFRGENPKPPSFARSIYDALDPHAVAGMLDLRMLFSALVDADFIETEAHFRGSREAPRVYRREGPELQAAPALELVRTYIRSRRKEVETCADASSDTVELREQLLESCLAAAEGDRGIYTLTGPTGSGKTLAMLAFGLAHAVRHGGPRGMRRIITVIPFLTIIEQTASDYRKIFEPHFGPEYLVEDHSHAGTGARGARHDRPPLKAAPLDQARDGVRQRDRGRLLAENYDAPLIVATSVQVLESLFANRPKPCRKLHRLARSVLLFDEVQTLPPCLAVVTLAAVARLVEGYDCTAVFATATQPAFEHLHTEVATQCRCGWKPDPIVPADTQKRMFDTSSRRTWVDWRLDEEITWPDLAKELADDENRQVLCIVNLKRHAVALLGKLDELSVGDGLLHLSTNLCPLHREAVLEEVKQRLKGGAPCRLVATQCVEAGVDVDFPAAYRALAPLEAIAQAAGRCNRGGIGHVPGKVTVFVPERQNNREFRYPPGYGDAAEHARDFVLRRMRERGREWAERLIHDPEAMREYFESFYELTGKAKIPDELADALEARDFERLAQAYRLIQSDTVRVLVPYDRKAYDRLRKHAERGLPFADARRWFGEAAPLAVNIYRPSRDEDTSALWPVLVGQRDHPEDAEWYVLLEDDASERLYDPELLGLRGINRTWIV